MRDSLINANALIGNNMGSVKLLVFVCCLILTIEKGSTSQKIIQKLTTGFATVLEKCKAELNIGDQVLQDFYNFWREDYQLVNKDLGCMVLCMASKFELIHEDMKLHHGNVHGLAKSHGADDEVANQLVTMIQECEKLHLGISEHCLRVLEVSKCFRTKIHGLKWAPSMEDIIQEIITFS